MHFHIMTLFPEMVLEGLRTSIIGRAEEKGCISIDAVNIRDYTLDKHKKVDDYTYGGGAGMLMQVQPVYDCWKALDEKISERKMSEKNYDHSNGFKGTRVGEHAGVYQRNEKGARAFDKFVNYVNEEG